MNKLVDIIKTEGVEQAVTLIKSHYAKSEYKGSWVDKITENLD